MDILGSIICGYCCARVIEFILTDPFNNSLTNIILSISLVYMTFYTGKADTNTKKCCPQSKRYESWYLS